MITIPSLLKGWIIHTIDLAHIFVDSINTHFYVSLPTMFGVNIAAESPNLCLKLTTSLHELCNTPTMWFTFLAQALIKTGFLPSPIDPGVLIDHGMEIVISPHHLLFFGPTAAKINAVILNLDRHGLRLPRFKPPYILYNHADSFTKGLDDATFQRLHFPFLRGSSVS